MLLAGRIAAEEPGAAPAAPKLGFKSHYLIDFTTDKVLASSAADVQLEPASLTKLMTAYVVFGALTTGRIRLDERAHVSEKAWRMRGTRMFIEVNSEVVVEDLVRGMLIQSGNDASVALAEHVAGSVDAFVAEMNAAAQALGMQSSAFRNPHGLPTRGHYSTARDLAVLAKAIIDEFPAYYGLYAEREFSYNGIAQHNRNALLWRDPSVDGMKTGYTDRAGYCLVTSAERDGMRLIAVVMGAPSARMRNDGAQKLLDFGFANFETHKLYSAGQEIDAARVWGGELEYTALGLAEDLYVTIPRGAYAKLAASMDVVAELAAPLVRGTTVGEVKVALAGEQVVKSPLVVLTSVLDGGVWARMRDELSLLWE
jgi:D-alanyl-D-alanine carboxypeptidase (penicillin-binding protein 5/6)